MAGHRDIRALPARPGALSRGLGLFLTADASVQRDVLTSRPSQAKWLFLARAALCWLCFLGIGTFGRIVAGNGLPSPPPASQPRDEPVSDNLVRQLVEEDWIKALIRPVATRSDAAGGCDGIKNGKYGFHTGLERNPWWQVDLGGVRPIGRIVVYNRLDYPPGLHNADNLQILTSNDGRYWTLRYENQGRHFGGIRGAAPLELRFAPGELATRFVRLQVASRKPVFFHLDEVEIYGLGDHSSNLALGRPADQSSLSRWSTAKRPMSVVEYPTARCIAQARRLAAELRHLGVDVSRFLRELSDAEAELKALPTDAPDRHRRQLYLRTRWIIRRLVFSNPFLDFDRLLFVKRFCQETYPDVCLNHMPWVCRPGGDICILTNPFAPSGTGQRVRYLLNGALGPGHVHGIDLWFDGSRVVFGYARASSSEPPAGWLDRRRSFDLRRTVEPIHLFEIDIGGQDLRQITRGQWSDLDPTYAPNGDIVFVSERCGTSLQCNEYDKDETSCNLYVVHPDGSGVRRLSVNKDGDYLPHTLDNGTIVYTRWEYHERSFAFIQSLWTIRPDGTGADALFKQHFANPWALEDARSIPGSSKLVAIATGHHTLAAGPLVIIDPLMGINVPAGIRIVTPGVRVPEGKMDGVAVPEGGVIDYRGYYATPWALSEKFFLISYAYGERPLGTPAAEVAPTGYGLYYVDVFGNKELIYRAPSISCFTPIPLRPRPRPPVVLEQFDPTTKYATCVVTEITRGCEAVRPEEVGYLRIAEPIGWPYDNRYGGHRYVEDHHCQKPSGEKKIPNENWTPIRILGDVPVGPDGSVTFRVPADTAVYFQLLDHQRMEIRRMRSFISFQPGETRACVGCHESRAEAPAIQTSPLELEFLDKPAQPIPPPWGDRPISFLRDVQPVLDRHCVRCHGGLEPAGGLDFCGGLTSFDLAVPGYGYNRAYVTIITNGLVACSPARQQDASITPPFAYGSHRSRLIQVLNDERHRDEVSLNGDDRLRLAMWIDANAPYHDRFVNKRAERPPYDPAADLKLGESLLVIHKRRCTACHRADEVTRLDWIDIRHPEQSLFLAAPLSKAAGGLGHCRPIVYVTPADSDYQAAWNLVKEAVGKTWSRPRRDVMSLQAGDSAAKRP